MFGETCVCFLGCFLQYEMERSYFSPDCFKQTARSWSKCSWRTRIQRRDVTAASFWVVTNVKWRWCLCEGTNLRLYVRQYTGRFLSTRPEMPLPPRYILPFGHIYFSFLLFLFVPCTWRNVCSCKFVWGQDWTLLVVTCMANWRTDWKP